MGPRVHFLPHHQPFSLSSRISKRFEYDIYNCQRTFPSNNFLAGFSNFHVIYLPLSKYTHAFSQLGSKSALCPHSPGPFFSLQLSKILLLIRIFNSTIFFWGFFIVSCFFSMYLPKDYLQTFPMFLIISQCSTWTSSSSDFYFWVISSIKINQTTHFSTSCCVFRLTTLYVSWSQWARSSSPLKIQQGAVVTTFSSGSTVYSSLRTRLS